MKFSSGDSLYYKENLALGFLIERYEHPDGVWWKYALRSPPRADLTNFLISLREEKEENFILAVQSGRLSHFKGK